MKSLRLQKSHIIWCYIYDFKLSNSTYSPNNATQRKDNFTTFIIEGPPYFFRDA